MKYRVSIYRCTTYEMEASCADEAFDLAFGPDQEQYETDQDTLDHSIVELEEVPA